MAIKTRTLAQISNRRTSYEVELVINGTVTHLGFTERKTRSVLIDMSRKAADAILPHVPEGLEWKYNQGQITWAPGVVVRFSGRTEYQIAVNQGARAMMDIHQFRATGRDCADLGAALSIDFGRDEPTRGRIYVDCLYIERMDDGRWTLLIGRCEWIESLPQLERRLYEFARSEGYLQ